MDSVTGKLLLEETACGPNRTCLWAKSCYSFVKQEKKGSAGPVEDCISLFATVSKSLALHAAMYTHTRTPAYTSIPVVLCLLSHPTPLAMAASWGHRESSQNPFPPRCEWAGAAGRPRAHITSLQEASSSPRAWSVDLVCVGASPAVRELMGRW